MNPWPVPERGAVARLIHNTEESHTMTYAEWLALHTRPLIGFDDDEDKGGKGGDDKDDDDASDKEKKRRAGNDDDDDADKGGKGGDDDDEDDDDDDAEVTLSAKEVDDLRKENARHRREAKQREKKDKDDKQKKAADEGKHEQLAQEAKEEAADEKAKREAAEYTLDQRERDIRTRDAASQLNFREPEDAIRFLNEDDTDSTESVTRALKKLADKKPYLLNDRPRSGRGGGGGSGKGGAQYTREEIENMSPEEIAKKMPDVRKALAAQQPKPAGGR